MALTEMAPSPTSDEQTVHPNKRKRKIIASVAAVGIGLAATFGIKALVDGPEQPKRPANFLEYCQTLAGNPNISAAFARKLPNTKISGDACQYKTDPVPQSFAAWGDPISKTGLRLIITDRALADGGDSLTYMREQIRLGRAAFQEISAVGDSEATMQSIGAKTGSVIMYFEGYSISVLFESYQDTRAGNFTGMQETALNLAGVVGDNIQLGL